MNICSWCRYQSVPWAHGTGTMGMCSWSCFQEQMTPKQSPETAPWSWILIKQNRKYGKCLKIYGYGTSRAENSSKSISEQFPIDWDTSRTPKSNQIYPNRAQRPDHAPTRVLRTTPYPQVKESYLLCDGQSTVNALSICQFAQCHHELHLFFRTSTANFDP